MGWGVDVRARLRGMDSGRRRAWALVDELRRVRDAPEFSLDFDDQFRAIFEAIEFLLLAHLMDIPED
jgi:hypothetical protein